MFTTVSYSELYQILLLLLYDIYKIPLRNHHWIFLLIFQYEMKNISDFCSKFIETPPKGFHLKKKFVFIFLAFNELKLLDYASNANKKKI